MYGELLQTIITEGTSKSHEGYKGGEYFFNSYDTPYLTNCPSSNSCFQIVGYKEDKISLKIILLTEDVGYKEDKISLKIILLTEDVGY